MSVITLPPILDALAAGELLDALRDTAPSGGGSIIDAAAVERLSTSAVQVLIAAARDGAHGRRRFQLRQPSPALTAGFADLGLARFLDTWTTQDETEDPRGR